MVSLETFRKLVLDLSEVTECLHFKRVMFGVGKKNFASFDPRTGELAFKLKPTGSNRLDGIQRGLLSIAPGKYGEHGWTKVDMGKIDAAEFVQLLNSAHAAVSIR